MKPKFAPQANCAKTKSDINKRRAAIGQWSKPEPGGLRFFGDSSMNPSVCESRRFVGGPAISTVPLAPPSIAVFFFGNQIKMLEKVSTRWSLAHRLAVLWSGRCAAFRWQQKSAPASWSVGRGTNQQWPDKRPPWQIFFLENKNNIFFFFFL